MRNEASPLLLLALVAGLSGCVTGGAPAARMNGNVVVVERSKEHPPAWVGAPTEKLSEGEGVYRYVEISGRMLDLPLGLKQTQLKALEGCRRALTASVREQIMEEGGSRLSSKSQAELQRLAGETVDELHGKYAKVADIYFERLEDRDAASGDPAAEFFAVYILVHFGKDRAGELYQVLGQRLQRSSDQALKRLAPSITSLSRSPDLSH